MQKIKIENFDTKKCNPLLNETKLSDYWNERKIFPKKIITVKIEMLFCNGEIKSEKILLTRQE